MSFETVRHLFRARKLFRAIIVCVAWVDRPPVSRPKLSSAPAQVIIRCIKGWVEAQLAVNLPSAGKIVQQTRPRHCFQKPLSMDGNPKAPIHRKSPDSRMWRGSLTLRINLVAFQPCCCYCQLPWQPNQWIEEFTFPEIPS